jgi:predicted RNA-binding protein YlqC (UPF0109 family)
MSARDDREAVDDAAVAHEEDLELDGLTDGYQEDPSESTIDSLRGLITFLVENLVDEPASAEIDIEQHGSAVQIRVNVPEEELGKIIGRGGRIAKAMRTALMIAGSRHHLRVSLDIEGKPA